MSPAVRVRELLEVAGGTLSTAESLTGGQLAARLTAVPGVSGVYVGGAVTYWTSFKESLLGVPAELVEEFGVVSAECAEAMARGIRGIAGSTYALSTTGVAGPDRQEDKAVGTVFVGLAGPGPAQSRAVRLTLDGDRADIQAQTCGAALALLLDELLARSSRE